MNGKTWVQRSAELARSVGYLDKLSEVYPVPVPEDRPLTQEQKDTIHRALTEGDDISLLKSLLNLYPGAKGFHFPYKEPYLGFLKLVLLS